MEREEFDEIIEGMKKLANIKRELQIRIQEVEEKKVKCEIGDSEEENMKQDRQEKNWCNLYPNVYSWMQIVVLLSYGSSEKFGV